MSNNTIVFSAPFTNGTTSPVFAMKGKSLDLQVVGTGTAVLQVSNVPGTWATLLTQAGAGSVTGTSFKAFGRLVFTGTGTVGLSSSI